MSKRLHVGQRVGVLIAGEVGTTLAPGIVRRVTDKDVNVETEHGVFEGLNHPDYVGPYIEPSDAVRAAWRRIEERSEEELK